MALDAAGCAQRITTMYLGLAGLQPSGDINPLNDDWTWNSSGVDFAQEFASIYNDYAKQGKVPGATNEGGDPSIIASVLGKEITPQILGMAFCNFWAQIALIPGPPAHGGISPVAVVNDAAAKMGLFVAAVQATITDKRSQPYFLNLIKNVESMAVKSIIWTVTELMPGAPPYPMTFPEAVS